MVPPIRVLDYFVEHLHYDVKREQREEPDAQTLQNDVSLQAEWQLLAASGEDGSERGKEHFVMHLNVSINRGDDVPDDRLYRVAVRMAGLFERDSLQTLEMQQPEAEYLKHTVASAVSTLYGAAREVLASLTSSSPFPKLMLPSIVPFAFASRLVDNAVAKSRDEEKDEKSSPGGENAS